MPVVLSKAKNQNGILDEENRFQCRKGFEKHTEIAGRGMDCVTVLGT